MNACVSRISSPLENFHRATNPENAHLNPIGAHQPCSPNSLTFRQNPMPLPTAAPEKSHL
nr:hypothetical protein X990_5434 [Burkholderia pseudomallei MSHR4868]